MVVRGRAARGCAAVLAALLAATAPAAAAVASSRTGVAQVTEAEPAEGAPAEPGEGAADPTGSADAPAPVSDPERAAAMAEPAIVVIDVRWEGFVRDRVTGERLDETPVVASTRCTGAGVGSEGYLVTTATCVRQVAVAAEAFGQVVARRVADGSIPLAAADDLLSELRATAMIGSDPDDENPAERTVTVRRTVTEDAPMAATVVAVADPADGDAALLKIARYHQPVLALAQEVDLGEEVVTVECPTEDGLVGVTTASPGPTAAEPVRPAFRTGIVATNEPRILIDPTDPAQPRSALPGGVVLNHDAALVGLVDVSLPERDVLVDAAVIRALIESAGVDTDPGQADRDFRAGLDAYYEGRYTESIEHFDAVLAIIPSHVQAHEYRDEAQDLRDERGGEPAPPVEDVMRWFDRFVNGRSGSLVGLGVLVAIMVFLIRRRHPHGDAVTAPASVEPAVAASVGPEPTSPAPSVPDGGQTADDTPYDRSC